MSVRVRWYRGRWTVFAQHPNIETASHKLERAIGPTDADKAKAERIAASLARKYSGRAKRNALDPVPVSQVFEDWILAYGSARKHSTQQTQVGLARNHIIPFFGDMDLRTVKRQDLMKFASHLVDEKGKSAALLKNALSLFRRVVNLAIEDGLEIENPAKRIGEHVKRMQLRHAGEVRRIDSWTAQEAAKILELCAQYEPRIYPGVLFALHTGARRGEVLGLQWADINPARREAHIRRGRVKAQTVTPKSNRGRFVALSGRLLEALEAHRKELRDSAPWAEELWVFPTKLRKQPMQEKTFREAWLRLKARFQPAGIRPLVFHSTRHTFATLALEAGKSVKWVAGMLGHADPSITLRIYAHAIRTEEQDLGFLDFGAEKKSSIRSIKGT